MKIISFFFIMSIEHKYCVSTLSIPCLTITYCKLIEKKYADVLNTCLETSKWYLMKKNIGE